MLNNLNSYLTLYVPIIWVNREMRFRHFVQLRSELLLGHKLLLLLLDNLVFLLVLILGHGGDQHVSEGDQIKDRVEYHDPLEILV